MPKSLPNIKLVRYTPNPEEAVALAAKLCYSNADIDELAVGIEESDVTGFISKLISMKHLSPIEHASFTFAIEGVSRSLLAQITRHRIASFSVKSQRYVGSEQEFNYIIPPAIEQLGPLAVIEYEQQMETIHGFYKGWLKRLEKGEKGNEDARFVLPNATETKMILTMNARELLHFFELRCCNRAQWEIREVAWEMLRLVLNVSPALFAKAGSNCCFSGCSEGKMNCGRAAEVRKRRGELQAKTPEKDV